jgi:integrase
LARPQRIILWTDFERRYLTDLARRCRSTTVAEARAVLMAFARVTGARTLGAARREAAAAYLAVRTAGTLPADERGPPLRQLRPATHNKHLRTLRAAFQWTMDCGLAEGQRNPCTGIRAMREAHLEQTIFARRAELERVALALGEDGPEFEAAGRLMAECGLRLGEVSHLCWRSVDLAGREIRIQPEPDGWRPKGLSGRLLMDDRLAGLLAGMEREARAEQRYGPERRAIGGDHPAAWERRMRRRLAAACGRAGLPVVKPHGLRRSYGTILANEGMEAVQLRTVMRHADLKTTLGYYITVNARRAAAAGRAAMRRAE